MLDGAVNKLSKFSGTTAEFIHALSALTCGIGAIIDCWRELECEGRGAA